MIGMCLALVGVGALISGLLCSVISCWAVPRDRPGAEAHKQHEHAVSNLGGIGIAAAVVIPAAVGLTWVWWGGGVVGGGVVGGGVVGGGVVGGGVVGGGVVSGGVVSGGVVSGGGGWGVLSPIVEHLPGLQQTTPMAVVLLVAMAGMHGLGVVDDHCGLGAGIKFVIELSIATVLVMATDTRVLMLLDAWGPRGYAGSVALTVLWIVAITNAMNMLDNMNGLAGGVGLIIAASLMVAALGGGQWFVAGLSGLMVGGLVGFLVWNYPRARLFMGDGGSLMLGLLLAFVSVRLTYWSSDAQTTTGHWIGVLSPVGLMALPLYDLTTVTIIRLKNGAPLWVGDHNHLSHRLVRRGWSKSVAVAWLWLWTAVTCAAGLFAWRWGG